MNAPFDPVKNETNIVKHGVSFDALHGFDWEQALTAEDDRKDYSETRYISVAPIQGRVHVLVWTVKDCVVRPISLRKANRREVNSYHQAMA